MSVVPVHVGIAVPAGQFFGRWPRVSAYIWFAASLVAALVAAVVTAELVSPLHIDAARARSAIETAITLSALVSAVLLGAHFNRTRRVRDLLLVVALATVSLTDFVFNAMPAFGIYQAGAYGLSARMACSLVVTGTFAAAALVPVWRRIGSRRSLAVRAALAGIAVLALGGSVDLIAGPGSTGGTPRAFEPIMVSVALASCCGLLIASFGFARRRGLNDREARLLAGVTFLLAGASLQKLALPLMPADWVTPADLLRVAAYTLVLATALHLRSRTREQIARDAIRAERLRIARDLHDGLAQDLAFIAAHSDRLALDFGAEHPLIIAAKRALAVSRGAIVDLEASRAPSAEAALREVAAELEGRFGIEIRVRIDAAGGPEPTILERSELVRIAREAIANAVHHGRARHVTVTLGSKRSDLLLRVSDDGCGLGRATGQSTAGTGLGMLTMQARARTLGGHLIVRLDERGGTEIDVIAAAGRAQPGA
jgi:signal transduction histidine kinase